MLVGVHVSTAGGIYESLSRAHALGCNTMQIFSRDPRQWRKAKLKSEDIQVFQKLKVQYRIKPIFVHIPYLINLASPYNILYKSSIKACIEDIREAESLGAEYLVTHMGSHKKSGESKGIKRISDALNRILDRTKECSVTILLENTAGSGSWLGYRFAHQRRVIEAVEHNQRVGICFDTCHAFVAGYDLSSAIGLKATIEEIEETVGLEKLKLIHLNDTKDELLSHKDRHEHIGKGRIGIEGFRRFVNDARLKNVPMILETPKDSPEADKINLAIIRKLKAEKVRYE